MENNKIKKVSVVLAIIGVVLVFSAIRSLYIIYDETKNDDNLYLKEQEIYQLNNYEENTNDNLVSIIVLCIGILFLISPIVLNDKSVEKLKEIKNIILKMSKRNIIKTVTICFWIYLGISLILILKNIFLVPDWNQIVVEYSKFQIIVECLVATFVRCSFR